MIKKPLTGYSLSLFKKRGRENTLIPSKPGKKVNITINC